MEREAPAERTDRGEDVEALEAELGELAAHLHATMARLVGLLDDFDAAGGWAGWGIRSLGHWAAINLGIDARSCREHLVVAERLRELPEVRARFETGELSYPKVRALARAARPETEAQWVELARHASVTQLCRIASAYRRATDVDDPERLAERHTRRDLGFENDPSGLVRLSGLLEPDDAALVKAALEAHMEHTWRHDPDTARTSGEEPEPIGARRADALVAMAETALASGPTPCLGGERNQVVVHVDAGVADGTNPDGRCHLAGGPTICAETARRRACDAVIRPLLEARGRPLEVGRAKRLVSAPQRRALAARDRGCTFPGCSLTRYVDAHHIVHWLQGGTTDLDNLTLLCRRHHRLHHEGGYRMARDESGRLCFFRPDGREIAPKPLPPVDPGCIRAGPGITADTPKALSGGESFDLADTVTALISAGSP